MVKGRVRTIVPRLAFKVGNLYMMYSFELGELEMTSERLMVHSFMLCILIV